jgi:hypothetical protein
VSARDDDPQAARRFPVLRHRPPPTGKHSKASRYFLKLSDGQLVEFARRICRLLANPGNVEPNAIKLTIVAFLENTPKC